MIAGFTRPASSRQYFGALLLGAYDQHGLRYVGKLGTGFDQKTLAALPLLSNFGVDTLIGHSGREPLVGRLVPGPP